MKLTTFILLISLMQVSAASFGQRVTLKQNNLTIDKVFREIRKQTGYDVLMGYGDFKASKINANFDNASLTEVMDVVVKNTELTYSIEEKTIVVKRKSVNSLYKIADKFNVIDVSGRVVDAEGRGLPGASISIKGKGKAVSSGTNGSFYLKGIDENTVLVVSFIGYVNKEIKAAANLGDVVLELSTSKLDEVQVIAYGTTTQRLSTGNVTTIKADVIEKQPVNNPLLALQGRVPGLFITQSSGLSGGQVAVNIQGLNSLGGGNDPFYVIDGVPFPSQNTGNNSILGSGNPLSFINPGDIESVDVLKDADATAIYGSRAANGAILITTKRGQSGETKVNLNLQSGIGQVAKKLGVLDTKQYLEMRKEAIKNDGLIIPAIPTSDFYDLTLYDQSRNTDWQKELIGKNALYNDFQASISGGSENTQFLFGTNYHKESTVFPGEFANKKAAVHFNISNKSSNGRFQFVFTGNYMNDNNKLPAVDLTSRSLQLIPNAPSLYDQNGELNWELYQGVPTWSNPLTYTLQKFNKETNNLIGNAEVSYIIISGLLAKTTFGYNKLQSNDFTLTPQTYFSPNVTQNLRSATNGTANLTSWIIEPQLNYVLNKKIGKIEFLLGSTFQNTKNDFISIYGSGFSSDSQLQNMQAASVVSVNNATQSIYNYNGLFARVNYNFQDRFLINMTARRDGSSRFGPENLFHNFYAVAGAWIFSNESWIKNSLPIISYGKFKLSYGTSGSDQIGDYRFLSLYDTYYTEISYGGGIGIKPTGHSNPYLQWEETRKINASLDLGFLSDRIVLNFNYYRNRSSNQLLGEALPLITGFSFITKNLAAVVQNKGFESTISSTNIKNKDFSWSSNLNITLNRNKLIQYTALESTVYRNRLVIGEPINITKAYKFAGVNQQTGLYEFQKQDGSLTNSPIDPEDKYALINRAPKFFGGLNNTFSYKGFTLDFLLQFVKQIGLDPTKFGFMWPGSYSANGAAPNQPVNILNRWQQVNDVSSIQKVSTDFSTVFFPYNFAGQSNAAFTDASYVRLKNLSFSWAVPNTWATRAHVKNAKIFFHGQNLATLTKFKGLDPESQAVGVPPLKILSFGIQLTL